MTDVVFLKKDNIIFGFECSGHSGYAKSGEDIVCSALSSMTQSCALGLIKVLKIDVDIVRDDNKGYLRVILPKDLEKDRLDNAQILLQTLLFSVKDLVVGYSKYIKLEERDDYVY